MSHSANSMDLSDNTTNSTSNSVSSPSPASASSTTTPTDPPHHLLSTYVYQLTQGCGNSQCTNDMCASNPRVDPFTRDTAIRCANSLERVHGNRRVCKHLDQSNIPLIPLPEPERSSSSTQSAPIVNASNSQSNSTPRAPLSDISPPTVYPSTSAAATTPSVSTIHASSNSSLNPSINHLSSSAMIVDNSDTMTDSSPTDTLAHPLPQSTSFSESMPISSDNGSISTSSSTPSTTSTTGITKMTINMDAANELTRILANSSEVTPEQITKFVKHTFSNFDLCMHLFHLTESHQDKDLPNVAEADVNWKEIEEFFTLVDSNEQIQEDFTSTLNILLKPRRPIDSQSTAYARFLFILMDYTSWFNPSYMNIFLSLCSSIAYLTAPHRKAIVNWIVRTYSSDRLSNLVQIINQFITVRWFVKNKIEDIGVAVSVLGLCYAANEEFERLNVKPIKPSDPASTKVIIQPIPFEAFYNDAINTELELGDDYRRWRMSQYSIFHAESSFSSSSFSFASHSYSLDPASKTRLLQIDAAYQKRAQLHAAFLESFFSRQANPYLVLKVNRQTLVADALVQLQNKSSEELKKPLKIVFEGESGIDEGGLQKEFFQLMIAAIFDVKYGMFLQDTENSVFLFNQMSLESGLEFEILGILLGLAVYNGVILDLHFPLYVFKKLLDIPTNFSDLAVSQPELAQGLQKLLDFDGDVESTYCRTFTVDLDVFGATVTHELKENGSQIALTNANREEYVRLYIDWILNKSIQKQFKPFYEGFQLCAGSPALKTFRAEELELCICGSEDLDFDALEGVTRYDDGFTADSRVVRDFWSIVHSMEDTQKRRLLAFCTGSDRVPIRGLASLQFTISRNGPDSDLLPTSHTCFNHLLLPEYATKDKLEHFLNLALQHSEGFGMI